MAIQKFKYGQEITSAKLNEIVSFLNSLEFNLSRVEYWNANVDQSLTAFQEQLNTIKTQVNELLNTAENFDILNSKFATILSEYYAIIEDNVQPLFDSFLGDLSITEPNEDGDSYWVFGNEVTSHLAGVKGDKGDQGVQGIQGPAGVDAPKVYLINTTFPSDPSTANGGEIAFRTSDFTIWKRHPSSLGGGWQKEGGSFKGATGTPGTNGYSLQIEFQYLDSKEQATGNSVPTNATKYIKFRTFKVTNNNVKIAGSESAWTTIQIRSDRYIPIIDAENGTLRWVLDEGEYAPSLDTYNIIGPQGPKGDKGDSGNEFVVKGLKANTGALPVSGAEGDAWFVGTAEPYDVYIWDVGLSTPAWVDVGPLQGPTGATGAKGDTGLTGATGPRGSKIFTIETGEVEDVVTGITFGGINLVLNDIFIEEETGHIKQVSLIDTVNTTTTFDLIYTLPSVHELIYDDQKLVPIENIVKGDVIQFVAIKNSKKLVAKATPFSGVSITYQSTAYSIANVNDSPELIMGIAGNDVSAGGSGLQIYNFGYIPNFQPSYLTFAVDETAILYFDSAETVNRGRLTKTEPSGDLIKLVCALFLGDNQDTLLVRVGHSYVIDDIKGLTTSLNSKAPIASPTFTGTVVLPSTTSIGNVSNTEISYLDGVTSAIQTQINSKQATITGGATSIVSSNLTTDRALVSNASGKVAVSTVSATELGYLSGVTSSIQTQLGLKADLVSGKVPASQLPNYIDDVISLSSSTIYADVNALVAAGFYSTGGDRRFLVKDTSNVQYSLKVYLLPGNTNGNVAGNFTLEKTIGRFNEYTEVILDRTTNKTYRISGSPWDYPYGSTTLAYPNIAENAFFVFIGSDLALGELSTTAYRGDHGKAAYDHSLVTSGNPHQVTATDVGLGNVTNESKATMFTNPTFTGTVSGVSKAMVGLGNVDNTSDLNKPVSTATQTALDGKASTSHSHLILLWSGSPTAVSNTSPYTTITFNATGAPTIQAGDRLLVIWGTNTSVKFRSEVFLINFGGSDYYAVLEKRFDFVAGNDATAFLSVQMGTSTTTGGYVGSQLTFRNGILQSLDGTQTGQTMYIQAIYKVVI